MKLVLYVENYFPGGLEKFVFDLCESGVFDLYLLINSENKRLQDYATKNSIMYTCVDLYNKKYSLNYKNKYLRKTINIVNFFVDYFYLVPNYFVVSRILKSLTYYENILIINGGYPAALSSFSVAVASKKSNFKNVGMSILSAPTSLYENSVFNFFQSKLDRFFSQYVDFYLPNSNNIKINLLKYTIIPEHKIHVVYTGIKFENKYGKMDYLQLNGFNLKKKSSQVWISMIGLLGSTKRQDLLIETLSQLNDNFNLLLVGDGPNKDNLESKVKSLGLEQRVFFVGWCDSTSEVYKFIDCVVFLSNHEGLPYAVTEAMASKVPIIASDIGGICEQIIDKKGGFLVNNDINNIVEKINYMIQNKDMTDGFTSFSYQRYLNKFSIDSMILKIKNEYKGK